VFNELKKRVSFPAASVSSKEELRDVEKALYTPSLKDRRLNIGRNIADASVDDPSFRTLNGLRASPSGYPLPLGRWYGEPLNMAVMHDSGITQQEPGMLMTLNDMYTKEGDYNRSKAILNDPPNETWAYYEGQAERPAPMYFQSKAAQLAALQFQHPSMSTDLRLLDTLSLVANTMFEFDEAVMRAARLRDEKMTVTAALRRLCGGLQLPRSEFHVVSKFQSAWQRSQAIVVGWSP
jgi:hypothetical protein